MRGGMAKTAWVVSEAHKSGPPVAFVDCGDALFAGVETEPSRVPQLRRKAQAISQAFKLMGIAASGVGKKDLAQGEDFLEGLQLPSVRDGAARMVELGHRKIAVVAGETKESLSKAAAQARPKADFVLGILHQPLGSAQTLFGDEAPVDFLIAARPEGELDAEESRLARGKLPMAQVQSKGRSLLRLDIAFHPADARGPFRLVETREDIEKQRLGLEERIDILTRQINAPGLKEEAKARYREKIAELADRRHRLSSTAPEGGSAPPGSMQARFLPVEASLPELPEARALVDTYHRDISQLNLRWAQENGKDCPAPAVEEAAYLGSESCRECHEETFPSWESSKHKESYATLKTAGRQYDLECVRCHVTGPDRPGGVCRVDKVEGRAEVGCESCHGPGSLHAQNPTAENVVAKPVQTDCIGCHDKENSPHFDFNRYLAQILGPGHGRPLNRGPPSPAPGPPGSRSGQGGP
jgi:hypothetical protein